jgi:gliding motility-associated-like protein
VIYFEVKEYSEITAEMDYLSNLVCFGDCNAKIKALISGGTPPYKFIWNTGEESDTLGNLCAGKYNLTVVDKNNCLLDTGITVISPQPLSVFIVKTNVPCISSCTGTATVDASGGTSPYRFAWSNGDTTKAVASLCKGDYSVTVTDKNLCRTVKNVKIIDSSFFPAITIKADPNPISAGGTSQITVTPVDTSWKYSWAPDNGLSSATSPTPSATPNKTTTYHLTITDKYGCTQIDSVRITLLDTRCDEPYIFIPNAFTPDATSNNILYVRSIVIEQLYFAIYNRWGEKVFETNDQKKGWDGTYRGEKCSPAVFDYYLEATCLNKQTYKHKGNITLIR